MVARGTRTANPCLLVYNALGIGEPEVPRTQADLLRPRRTAAIDPDLAGRFEEGLRRLAQECVPQPLGAASVVLTWPARDCHHSHPDLRPRDMLTWA